MKLNPYLIPHRKVNSKMVHDLNVKIKTRKLVEKNLAVNLHNFGFGNGF